MSPVNPVSTVETKYVELKDLKVGDVILYSWLDNGEQLYYIAEVLNINDGVQIRDFWSATDSFYANDGEIVQLSLQENYMSKITVLFTQPNLVEETKKAMQNQFPELLL